MTTTGSPTRSEESSSDDDTLSKASSKNDDKKKRQRIKQWLRAELRCEWFLVSAGSIAMIVSSLSNAALPRLMGNLLDQKSNGRRSSSNSSSSATLPLLAVVLGGGMASFLRTTMLNRAEENIASRLRTQVFRALLMHKDVEWFQNESFQSADNEDDAPTTEKKASTTKADTSEPASKQQPPADEPTGMTPGAIATVLNDDVTKIAHSMTATTANLLRSTSSCVFSTYNMLRLNPSLFITSVCTVPLIGMAAMTMRKFLKRITNKRQEQAMRAAAFAEERISQIGMVKMSNREQDEVDAYEAMQKECADIGRQESLANGAFMGFTFSATSSALFMVVHLGGRAVAAKRMTSGQLTSFATYSFLLGLAASGIVKSLGEVFQSMIGAQRVYDMAHNSDVDNMETDSERSSQASQQQPQEPPVPTNVSVVDSISLRNITFGYKSRPDATVLRNVSMDLKRGTVLALCGKNGSGKSTTASLLAGLYRPDAGSVTLLPDGINYHSLDRAVQKQLVQVVPQSAPLFNMSILDNVRYSNPSASLEDVNKALNAANCKGFVSKLPRGINFVVGMHGCKLSAGQRQRLALARALVADPFCLVLDEAQASMDAEGESAVADAVLACRGSGGAADGRALLLITHRPKSLDVADRVVVLRDGEVVETGSLKELKAKKNSELCKLMPDVLKL